VELASRAGLTRQAVSSIEASHYIPNTAVALRLAQALNCDVEDLFILDSAASEMSVDIVGGRRSDTSRLVLARVGERLLGYPLSEGRALQQGFQGADGLATGARGAHATLLAPPELLEKTAVLFGCDPSLGILGAHVARRPDVRIVWLSAASEAALDAIGQGEAHVAGTHLPEPGDDFNLGHARRCLGPAGGLVVEFARWELGLVVASGNPRSIAAASDLTRSDVRIVNREHGSGSRALLDGLLERESIPGASVNGYEREVSTHVAAAAAVATGGADAAIALRATAAAMGLDFVPIDEVHFDFVVPRRHVDHPAVARMLDVLQTGALRAELQALPGYNVAGIGTVRLDIPVATP